MHYPPMQIRMFGIQRMGAHEHPNSLQVFLCRRIRDLPPGSRLRQSTYFVEWRHHILRSKCPSFVAQAPIGPSNICPRVRGGPRPRPISDPLGHRLSDGGAQGLCPQTGWLWLRKECGCVKKTMRRLQNDVLIHPFCCLHRLLRAVPYGQLFSPC
jgi:hypothetical protein